MLAHSIFMVTTHSSDEHIGDLNKVNLIDFPTFSSLGIQHEQKFIDNKVAFEWGNGD
jgi:hypothetical protein